MEARNSRGAMEARNGRSIIDAKDSRRHRKKNGVFLGFCFTIFGLMVFLLGTFFVFQTENINVVGANHVDEDVVIEWVKESPLSMNALYIMLRHNYLREDLPPGIASLEVELITFRDLEIRVIEREMIVYVAHHDGKVYFDGDGIPALIVDREIAGALEIKGLDLDSEELVLGMALSKEKKQVMNNVRDVLLFAENLELEPDHLLVEGESITLYFGEVRASLGNRDFWDRMSQIPPILQQLSMRYPGKSGVVQLERFLTSGNFIHFVPDEPI